MPRLIDADELIERAYRERLDNRELITQMIESAPTVDAIPIVRCKDCKYYYVYDRNNEKHNFCDLDIEMLRDLDPNYYCASAERREDGNN